MSGGLGADLWDAVGPGWFVVTCAGLLVAGGIVTVLAAKRVGLMPKWRGWFPSVKEMDRW